MKKLRIIILQRGLMKLTKQEQETYDKCLGQCSHYLLNGECELQKKLDERKRENENQETNHDYS